MHVNGGYIRYDYLPTGEIAPQSLTEMPDLAGTYALQFILRYDKVLRIGRLGEFLFSAGKYLYIGSAHGFGGLRARVRHHLISPAAPRWHLDYLRPFAIFTGCYYVKGIDTLECDWSQHLAAMNGISIPVPGFGAGDCQKGCAAHLVMLSLELVNEDFAEVF